MQSSLINKAYRILESPIRRAVYFCELNNHRYEKEATHSESDEDKQQILMEVFELNQAIDEIEYPEQVEKLEKDLEKILSPLEKELESAFKAKNFKLAIKLVDKLNYFKNIDERLKDLKLKFNLTNL